MARKLIKPPKSDPILKVVRITCQGAIALSIHNLKEFQGDLKELLEEDYLRLKSEIVEEGFSFAVQVWQNDGNNWVMDGHQRLRTVIRMEIEGWTIPDVPASLVFADNYQQAKRKCLGAASNYGRVTNDGLLAYIQDMEFTPLQLEESYRFGDLDLHKFVDSNFDEHLKTVEVTSHERTLAPPPGCDEDEVPEQPEPRTKLGDIIHLGVHRLMCGDSTNIQSVEKLMNGEKADLWSSDPPYGINHVEVSNEKGQSKGYEKIANDELTNDALKDFLLKSIQASLPHLSKGFAFYMWHAMKMQAYFSQAAAAAAGILFHRQIIWVKPQFVFGRGHYHWRHELCLMGWLTGNEPEFYGERNQSTVWEVARENDKIHPTQKPVELFSIPIRNHLKRNQIVYEPFSGSGSNFIAAEKESVRCFGMDISPHYCDVIIARWEKFTGKQAELLPQESC